MPTSAYPGKLGSIIAFFETLSEPEKRENLIAYAETSAKHAPTPGDAFDLEDVRKDEECTDTVGLFLRVDASGGSHFRIALGAHVQTLTRAMAGILCKGLDGARPQEVLDIPADFVERIVGQTLVRVRSQTTYYVLSRMKGICRVWLERQRASEK